MKVKDILQKGFSELTESTTPQLDSEVLLGFILNKDKNWIHLHLESEVKEKDLEKFLELIAKRKTGFPIAYITESKDFYGRSFNVSQDVLIPRPETETLIEQVLSDHVDNKLDLLEIGTGSGVIPITLKKERPNWKIIASDISERALDIAKQNARNLNADIQFYQSDLLESIPKSQYNIIVANLPYLTQSDLQDSPTAIELTYEPISALVAEDNGLALIKQLIAQSQAYLKQTGVIYLELEPAQVPLLREWIDPHSLPFSVQAFTDLKNEHRFLKLQLEAKNK